MKPLDTKTNLLNVAERLFAEQGIDATSLRNIISEADVNLAAIHYHFGSKELLIREVFARRIEPINQERLKRLDELESRAGSDGPESEELIRAFIEPVILTNYQDPERVILILRLITQLQSDRGKLKTHFAEFFAEIAQRFLAAFHKSLPHLSLPELSWRFRFMLGVMFMTMAKPPFDDNRLFRDTEMEPERIIARVVPFLLAGFEAPAEDPVEEGPSS